MSNEEPIQVIGNPGEFDLSFKKLSEENGLSTYSLEMKSDRPTTLNPINLKWSIPAHNVKGVWSTNALHEKRLRADWESSSVEARLSVDAPVMCLFGHEDENILTFA
ncbi:MAG: alpha-galactosidase, partial [Bacteroidota bacterium]